MPEKKDEPPAIGIIGGSGLYQIEELRDISELNIDTPFGPPSDMLIGGKISGRRFTSYRDMAAVTGFCRTKSITEPTFTPCAR